MRKRLLGTNELYLFILIVLFLCLSMTKLLFAGQTIDLPVKELTLIESKDFCSLTFKTGEF